MYDRKSWIPGTRKATGIERDSSYWNRYDGFMPQTATQHFHLDKELNTIFFHRQEEHRVPTRYFCFGAVGSFRCEVYGTMMSECPDLSETVKSTAVNISTLYLFTLYSNVSSFLTELKRSLTEEVSTYPNRPPRCLHLEKAPEDITLTTRYIIQKNHIIWEGLSMSTQTPALPGPAVGLSTARGRRDFLNLAPHAAEELFLNR
ncbi:hypothetical protein IW262DRAFT_1508275 [Armillaria fumosa]|nr:hypothetical protein IW262DRAFT_1508275 [Armillaria fumosa]